MCSRAASADGGAFTHVSNGMLLAAIPGSVGGGRQITVSNAIGGASAQQGTFIGANLGEAQLRRFLVGPVGC